ncbi:MAG: winged helix-turn-helix domain-containing protein [Candidatus Thiodiazotropha sp.]
MAALASTDDLSLTRGYSLGQWRVDPSGSRIFRDGDSIRLEPKVMEVLGYLVAHRGELVTREALERDVWRGALIGYDSITSTIIKLRKALNDDAHNPEYIETVPKRGYRLIAEVSGLSANDEARAAFVDQDAPVKPPARQRKFKPAGLVWILLPAVLLIAASIWLLSRPMDKGPPPLSETPAPTTPSLVVLPFDNISDDPEQDDFSDGMTEDIITDLSRLSHLRVISSNTAFTYKNRLPSPQRIGEELGVDYLLAGSVRRQGDALRVNARLVDTRTGFQKWATRYDRRLEEVFSLQDELAGSIVEALALQLTAQEKALIARKTTTSLHAYDLFLEGQRLSRVSTRETNEAAQSAYRQAIQEDPDYGRAYGALAYNMAFAYRRGWSDRPRETLDRALELARAGVALDSSIPQTYWSLGYVYMMNKEFGKAKEAVRKAIAIAPNYGDGYGLLALIHNNLGEAEEAVHMVTKGMQLNPYYTWDYPYNLGKAYYLLGRYEEAIDALTDSLERNEFSIIPRLYLAASYVRAGRQEDAEWEVDQIRVMNPTSTLTHTRNALPIERPEMMEAFLADLKRAGLPE